MSKTGTFIDYLICKSSDGGWWLPTVEKPPGIFIEQCSKDEHCEWLTWDEFVGLVIPLWNRLLESGWTRTGFEVGREYGNICVKTHIFDFPALIALSKWKLGDELSSGEEYKRWAIEFLDPEQKKYIRRAFQVITKYEVPDMDDHGRVRKEMSEERRERNKKRIEERLKCIELRKCERRKLQRLQEGQIELL